MKVPNQYRIRQGPLASNDSYGNNGAFKIPKGKKKIAVIASDGMGWGHVSVSLRHRCPTWEEMCFIKDLFWDPEETVIQFHPPKSKYINNHRYGLHMWRPIETLIQLPLEFMIGLKGLRLY